MADAVQFKVESMVDELEDLVKRNLFTCPEIDEIVNRRRDFEYRLRRPRPRRQDFLDYVDYEAKIDALRVIRKKKIIGEMKRKRGERKGGEGKKGKLWKRSVSDVAGVERILGIYKIAIMRFKGDLDIWYRCLEFCRERKHGKMKQLLAKAIRFHPKVPGLWIYAAAWEFDQQLNVSAARALMQRGLRENPNSEEIWIEYLRMELTYLNKLKARKIALGEEIGVPSKVHKADEERWKEENEDLFLSLNEEQGPKEKDTQDEQSEDFFWKHGSSVLRTIYQGAVEVMPSSMSIRRRFLEILDDVDLVHSEVLKDEVMEDIKKQFSNKEDYWDWIARFHIGDLEKIKSLPKTEALCLLSKALQVYDEALCLLPTIKMFSLFAKFFEELLSLIPMLSITVDDFDTNMLKIIFEKAESSGLMSDDLAHHYVTYYLQMGKWDEARRLAEKLCAGPSAEGPKLWSLRISMEMKCQLNGSSVIGTPELNSIFSLFKLAADRVPISGSETLWQEAISFFSDRKEYFEKLTELFVIQLVKSSCIGSLFSVFCGILNWIFQRRGIRSARKFYERILSLPCPSLSIFLRCIELESNLAISGDQSALPKARKTFEAAISVYGENPKLWKDYHYFETKVGTTETASAIYWRSKKILKGIDLLTNN